ncbi:hypothetical protein FRC09_020500 [Ceratobasidium sp. 395]|nr:hypothetical protein FRC09_020500 [Ceratobasidium sp. 395]
MPSKRANCTVERDGRANVRVRVEHVADSDSKGTQRRRKAPRKEIHVETKGSLPLSAEHIEQTLRARANDDSQVPSGSGSQVPNDDGSQVPNDDFPDEVTGFETFLDEALANMNLASEETNETPGRKTSNFYLREWLDKSFDAYMHVFFDRDAPPKSDCCESCLNVAESFYRCTSCLGRAALCSGCIVASHRSQPTHRIREWDGKCWVDSSLSSVGLTIYLGHGGKPCDDNDKTWTLLVGDLNGFTEISVRYCTHSKPVQKALQLLDVGLFPCTDEHPKTAFTFPMLDMYDALTTVARTSGHKYYSALERVTNPGFPDDVKDRYREMMTTHRKHLHMEKQCRSGYSFKAHPIIDVHPGDQAFDCVACPRPGFNFEWDEVPEDERPWFRIFVSYDGNFRSSRKAKKVDAGDICLSDGVAYFSHKAPYKEWIDSCPQPKRAVKPVCDHHKAGNDTSVRWVGKSITGIGAFTCTSHSCFIPRGAVDYFRGELFWYCDYAFACMYHYLRKRGYIPIGMTYDIWCHWWVNFLKSRAANLPEHLRLPADLDLIGAIPKWHLIGHDRECLIRWAMEFMRYIGRMEGEGPERVWAHLNEHSGSTSEQSPGQRTESINNIAGDWNYRKAITMHRTLPARARDAKKMRNREKANLDGLTSSLPDTKIALWQGMEPEPTWDPSTKQWSSLCMDPVLTGGAQAALQEERDLENPTSRIAGRRPGVARCFMEGIELEHSVRSYNEDAKKIGKKPTPKQAETLNSKRMALQDRMEKFQKKLTAYMGDVGEPDLPRPQPLLDEDLEEDNIDLGMPSSYAPGTLEAAGLSTLAELERKLRRGVCVDSIDSVKRLLGAKAAAINYKKTQISGQVAVTRSESRIRAHTAKIEGVRWRYLNSRGALIKLGMKGDDEATYLDLVESDLISLKTHFENYTASRTGRGTTKISWIWRSAAIPTTDDWEVDALQPEWFRARERFRRWDEQLVMVKREMILSIRSFQKYQELWEWRASNGCPTPGMQVYAIRRSRLFAELARRMLVACHDYLKDDTVSLGWCDKWLSANMSGI